VADELDQIIERHQRQVLMTAYRIVGNMEDARDAAQEVFFRLYKYRGSLKPDHELGPWLYRATVNVCFDMLRRRPRLALVDAPELADTSPTPDAVVHLEERRRMLHSALQRLPEKERAAVVLREIEGLETAEVAEILGSSEATVRSQISMGKAKLREICGALSGDQP